MNICSRALRGANIGRHIFQSNRKAGGYLKKNIYVEENAGLRENGYKTWNFNGSNSMTIFLFLVIPSALFYFTAVDEMKIKDQQIGKKREYGLFPRSSAAEPK